MKNGILINPRSSNAVKKSIESICNKELKLMGNSSYKLYKSEFSERVVYKSLVDIYKIKIK